jgi:ABC-2 type transport system permease protein
MNALIKTEWRKLASTRTPRIALGGLLAFVMFMAFATMADVGRPDGTPAKEALELLILAPGLFTAIALLLFGAIGAAGEFQHRTITSTYLITPRRERVFAAKVAAYGILGAAVAAFAVVTAFPIGLATAAGNDVHVAGAGELIWLALGLILGGAAAGASGVAAGTMLRSQTTIVLVLLGWVTIGERMLGLPILPFNSYLTSIRLVGDNGPPAGVGAALTLAWTAALVTVAARRFVPRDVS